MRLIKDAFPACKTILGISNVSFGLPPAGREVLNSVFLYDCVKAGLDMAIVNSEKLERYALDSRRRAAAVRGSDLLAGHRSGSGVCRPFPAAQNKPKGGDGQRAAAR